MQASPHTLRGLLIDMDGTFVDHHETLARCFQFACRELGFPEPSRASVRRSIGGSMPVTIEKFLPPDRVEAGKELWRRRFDEIHLQGVRVLPGAEALLETCHSSGRKAAIFTNKSGRHSRAIIEQEGFAPQLAFVLGADDTPYRKPQPEFSAEALQRLGLPGEQVAVIGDSPFDVQAARAGGMTALGVTTGSHSRQELQEAGAHLVFDSLAQIADWLDRAPEPSRR